MRELLPALAFSLVIGAQFLAVIAMHEREPDKRTRGTDFRQCVDATAAAGSARI